MTIINPAIKELWIAALEGDTYTQGRDLMHSDDGSMCCLGVLCDLYRITTGIGDWVPRTAVNGGYAFVVPDSETSYGLPPAVQQWIGFDDSVPVVEGANLAVLNDGPVDKPHLAWDFKKIEARIKADSADRVIEQLTGFAADEIDDIVETLAKNSRRVGAATDEDISAILDEMTMNADVTISELERMVAHVVKIIR